MEAVLEKYKNIIVPIIVGHVPNAKIILYGSRARGDAREGSDIDVALDTGSTIDSFLMNNIIGYLEDSDLPISYDIVDFAQMSEDMKKNIMKDGIVWKR